MTAYDSTSTLLVCRHSELYRAFADVQNVACVLQHPVAFIENERLENEQ